MSLRTQNQVGESDRMIHKFYCHLVDNFLTTKNYINSPIQPVSIFI